MADTAKSPINVVDHNSIAWDNQVKQARSPWVVPVDETVIANARAGVLELLLTPTRFVPRAWFGAVKGAKVLCLASGGGQQVPTLAAAGADVVSFDNSAQQLGKDQLVADREGLYITTMQGDMRDLSALADATFDVIFHPVSNVFCPDIEPVWQHCARVLKPGGRLLSGFMNPDFYLFDHASIEAGGPKSVAFSLPFSDLEETSEEELMRRQARGEAIEFSHSLDTQIGGQLQAGLVIAGFYEDRWSNEATPLNQYMPTSMATLAIKPDKPLLG